MTYRIGSSFAVKLGDADRARNGALEVIAYLRRHHPDVSFRCFGENDARLARFHLFQDAADEAALMRVRQTTAADSAYLRLSTVISDLIVETLGQPSPYVDIER